MDVKMYGDYEMKSDVRGLNGVRRVTLTDPNKRWRFEIEQLGDNTLSIRKVSDGTDAILIIPEVSNKIKIR